MKSHISIIMPAYNEGNCIFENISMTRRVMHDAGVSAEIIAVDDGSTDNTYPEIRRAERTFDNVVVARNPHNMGKGMALRSGFERSSGDTVVFLDADLDIDPSQIIMIIRVLEDTPCDIVVTSKHHPESRLQYPLSRKIASWVYYFMIKNLFNLPVRDTQTGLKVFRRKVLDDVLPRLLVKKFAYDVELLAAAVRFGYKVSEVPVVLEFKRDLKWGRIRIEDVMSLFIDTLAVFYRLKIMRYYDSERPPLSQEKKSLLVIFHGCSPTEEVKDRLIADSVRFACMHEGATDEEIAGVLAFRGIDDLVSWLRNAPHSFDFVGFIGDGCIPVGSWVKYAVSNFDDPFVQAVCGPVIPGLCKSRLEKAAGLVFSAGIVRGSDTYLYSFRPVRNVHRALMENVFVRASLLTLENPDNTDFIMSGGYMCARRFHKGILRYDPDVAVLKKVPSLFMPYIRTVAVEEFLKGFSAIRHKHECMSLRPLVFTAILIVLAGGLAVLPGNANMIIWSVYGAAVIITSLTCFNLISAPFFAIGIVCDHLVRGCAFPAGVIKGVFSGMMRHKNLKSKINKKA